MSEEIAVLKAKQDARWSGEAAALLDKALGDAMLPEERFARTKFRETLSAAFPDMRVREQDVESTRVYCSGRPRYFELALYLRKPPAVNFGPVFDGFDHAVVYVLVGTTIHAKRVYTNAGALSRARRHPGFSSGVDPAYVKASDALVPPGYP
jgi:hypothetical protein